MMNRYFTFLCDIVKNDSEYNMLLRRLHHHEFYSFIPHDDNRASDGLKLREIFFDTEGGHMASSSLPDGPCTVLEMLIGLSFRMEIDLAVGENAKTVSECFWELIENLKLLWAHDDAYFEEGAVEEIDSMIRDFLDRRYDADGTGGLFPLKNTKKDQRIVEIWYQMAEYLLENYQFI